MSNENHFEVEILDIIEEELRDLYEEVQVEFNFHPDFDLPVGRELSF